MDVYNNIEGNSKHKLYYMQITYRDILKHNNTFHQRKGVVVFVTLLNFYLCNTGRNRNILTFDYTA